MTSTLHDPIEIPPRLQNRPRDKNGRVVPWFVGWVDGQPDFRLMDGPKLVRAVKLKLCWLCGGPLGAHKTFVIGPMCAVNRTSAEPPSHHDCAAYSAQVCPFLANPQKRRRESRIPEDAEEPAGIMLRRNPGVTLLWSTRKYTLFSDGRGGTLFDIGEATEVEWYAEGRVATQAEVVASIESGLPALRKLAAEDGPAANAELDRRLAAALEWVPAAV